MLDFTFTPDIFNLKCHFSVWLIDVAKVVRKDPFPKGSDLNRSSQGLNNDFKNPICFLKLTTTDSKL